MALQNTSTRFAQLIHRQRIDHPVRYHAFRDAGGAKCWCCSHLTRLGLAVERNYWPSRVSCQQSPKCAIMLFVMLGIVLLPSHAPGTSSRKELLAQSRELPTIAQMRYHAFRDAG